MRKKEYEANVEKLKQETHDKFKDIPIGDIITEIVVQRRQHDYTYACVQDSKYGYEWERSRKVIPSRVMQGVIVERAGKAEDYLKRALEAEEKLNNLQKALSAINES